MAGRNEQVIGYLQSLDIKTSRFGGFNKEDVFVHFKELSDIYEAERSTLMTNADELTQQNLALQAELVDKKSAVDTLEAANSELEQRYAALQNNVASSVEEAKNTPSREDEERGNADSVMYLAFLSEFKEFTTEKREALKLKAEAEEAREQLRTCRDAIDQLLQ